MNQSNLDQDHNRPLRGGRVAKFGGTSVQDATAMRRCAAIVAKDPLIKIVVCSATAKTTNALEEIAREALACGEVGPLVDALRARHLHIAEQLQVASKTQAKVTQLCQELAQLGQGVCLLKELSPKTMDQIYSIGERLSSVLFTEALNEALSQAHREGLTPRQAHLRPAPEVLITNDQFGGALPELAEIKRRVHGHWGELLADPAAVIVTQGFIGATYGGDLTTLGREGSDFSATLLGEAIGSEQIQIWKDVPGIATTDPRIIEGVQFIPQLSYDEMTELSTLGAKVLHPFTLRPAHRHHIPVFVGNSYAPQQGGTWIQARSDHRPLVQALALREHQRLVTVKSNLKRPCGHFFAIVFDLLHRHHLPLDLVTTYENQLTFLLSPRIELSEELLGELAQHGEVSVECDLALLSLVGHGMSETKGFMTRLFALLEDYRVRQINFGTGKHGLSLMVQQGQGRELLTLLHRHYIEEKSEAKNPEWQAASC